MEAGTIAAPRRSITAASTTLRKYGSYPGFQCQIIVEHDNAALSPGTLSVMSVAKQLGGSVDMLVAGKGTAAVAEAASKVDGVSTVYHAESDALGYAVAEDMAAVTLACQEAKTYSHILSTSSNFGKNFMPRVAAKLDVQAVSDIIGVEGEDLFRKPVYAGNAIATLHSKDSVKVVTVRPTSFEKAAHEGGAASVEDAPSFTATDKVKVISEEKTKSDRPDLGSAKVVVSGGRGMKSGENFAMLEELADKLGGAVGASRAAVDAGFVPNDMQVGQTGKVVAPDLYFAVGISGAIQHLAGMKDSKVIVAVNKDAEAPIFQVADYGLVEDLFKAVPELSEKIKK